MTSTQTAPTARVYLSPAELGQRHHKATGTLANERSAGKGVPFVKFGPRKVLYPLAEVEAFEARHLAKVTVPSRGGEAPLPAIHLDVLGKRASLAGQSE